MDFKRASDDQLARIIWDYMLLHHHLEPADVILCLGSHDTSGAERTAELYKQGLAPTVLFSGGFGRVTGDTFAKSEAETFAKIAIKLGIPTEAILLEDQSTNTTDNIRFSAQLLSKNNLTVKQLILVQKPYMERRSLAVFETNWPKPQPKVQVTSIQLTFSQYCQRVGKDWTINHMVGDLQRIREYSKQGSQSFQEIPDEVWRAWEELVARGYDQSLLK